jgi:cell division septal protein FtsQ
MDKRVRARRRTVGRQRGRRRAAAALIIVAVIACAALFLWLRASDVFAVKRVTATSTDHVAIEEIYQATVGARGVSLLRFSTAGIKAELSSLPYVRAVEVHRRFPDTLEVELLEYAPAARVRAPSGEVWLVAEDGRVLEKTGAADLPLVVAAGALSFAPGEYVPTVVADALPLARLMVSWGAPPATLPAMDHIAVSTGGELTVVFEGGTELRLGSPQELDQKLTVSESIIEQYLRDGRQLLYVDASVPDRVAVKAE